MSISVKKFVSVLSLAAIISGSPADSAWAQEWKSVAIRSQNEFQSIQSSLGNWISAYSGGFPMRLQGVVVNANEAWLDPTAAFDSGFHPYSPGGQAEIIVEAAAVGDFGGTFCWMGQNYGNMPWIKDTDFNYTNEQWYAELNRLQLWHPNATGLPETLSYLQLVRPGDYVEIRARAGLEYAGKMNVNEMHNNAPNVDFEVVVLERGRGWSEPANLMLADLKNADNTFIFNPADPQATGGEHYQGSQVTLRNVHFVSPGIWGKDQDVEVADDAGRTFDVHLSLGAGFTNYSAPLGTFSITGIFDQDSSAGNSGYRLLAMNSGDLFQSWNAPGIGFWSEPANWGSDAPVAGEGIHFAGAAGGTAENDFTAGRAVGGIVFESEAGEFVLNGNAILLSGNLISFNAQKQTVATPLSLTGEDHTIYAAAGEIVVESSLQNNGNLRKIGSGTLTLAKGIRGNGVLYVTNGVLNATSIEQDTLIIGGTASPSNSTAVPEPAAWLLIAAAAAIFLMSGIGSCKPNFNGKGAP